MKLKAQKREITGKKVKNLRLKGLVPATIFGPKKPSENIQFEKKEFLKLFKEVGFNKFFDLEVDNAKPFKVLVKEIQKHPITDNLLTAGIYQIDEDRKLTVEVPIIFTGESPAIKQNLGFLIQKMNAIAVDCLPKDLPSAFEVDISILQNPGSAITIADVKLPENVTLNSSMDLTSALVYIGTSQKEDVNAKAAEASATTESSTTQASDSDKK